jgi:hypothetical protein
MSTATAHHPSKENKKMNYRNIRCRAGGATAAAGISLAALLAACGGGSTTASGSTTTTPPGSGSGPSATGAGAFPGAVGSVASLSSSSMEVQNQQTGQVTVSWTPSTSFTESTTAAASSVAVGDCVVVTGSSSNGSLTARTVGVSQPSASGTCTTTRPTAGGGRPGSGTAPSGAAGGGSGTPISFTSGKVTAVSAGSLAVYGTSAVGGPGSSTTAPSSNITIDLSSSTTYPKTAPAASTNLAVGDCVTAAGPSTSTGAVTASSVRITSTGGQTCSTGFGRAGQGAGNG